MTSVARDLKAFEDTVDKELKAAMRVLHPQWSDEVLEQHIKGLHSAEWTEAYRDVFHEPKAEMASPKGQSLKRTAGIGRV